MWLAKDWDDAFAELEKYYKRDWTYTERVLPALCYGAGERRAIVCL